MLKKARLVTSNVRTLITHNNDAAMRRRVNKRAVEIEKLASTLPPTDMVFRNGEWIAVAYSDTWYPGMQQCFTTFQICFQALSKYDGI